jgi:hypothetical protein
MRTLLLVLAAPFAVVAMVAGCNGYDAQRATDYCQADRVNRGDCVGEKQYNECLSCFESCGDACTAKGDCPTTYHCAQ